MQRRQRVRPGAYTARLGGMALVCALAAFGCGGRLAPGEVGPPSYLIAGWEVVGEERIDRTWLQYVLRGVCLNTGPPSACAAGISDSTSTLTDSVVANHSRVSHY